MGTNSIEFSRADNFNVICNELRLIPKHQAALILGNLMYDVSLPELAEDFGWSLRKTSSVYNKGLRLLRKRLKDKIDEK